MSSVVNRSTKVYLRSVHTPDYPIQDWVIDPDLSAVIGVDNKYLVVTGDIISEMGAAAKSVVDAAEISTRRDAEADKLNQTQDVMVEFFKLVIEELNTLRQQFNTTTGEVTQLNTTTYTPRTMAQLKTALRNALGK